MSNVNKSAEPDGDEQWYERCCGRIMLALESGLNHGFPQIHETDAGLLVWCAPTPSVTSEGCYEFGAEESA
jgi:hypothetical protein